MKRTLVMEQEQTIRALEIKWASTFSHHFTKGLDIFAQDMAPAQVDAWIIAGSHEHQPRSQFTLTGWHRLGRFLESLDG